MPNPNTDYPPADTDEPEGDGDCACVLVINANDPTGAGGLTADILAVACVGAHPLPVVTGVYRKDTSETLNYTALDDEAVAEQARAVLEDIPVKAFKIGFLGSPETVSSIAEIASDYDETPLIAYMSALAWWDEASVDNYLDAYTELLLPQVTVLVGNHSTLWRWLLPDWSGQKSPSPRDIARAAANHGVPYTLITGIAAPDQFIDNVLATPESVLYSQKFERFEATFEGAGETLSATLTALLASGADLVEAVKEALVFLDRSLDSGFRPGMGHVIPDRLFWASPEDDELPEPLTDEERSILNTLEMPASSTKH